MGLEPIQINTELKPPKDMQKNSRFFTTEHTKAKQEYWETTNVMTDGSQLQKYYSTLASKQIEQLLLDAGGQNHHNTIQNPETHFKRQRLLNSHKTELGEYHCEGGILITVNGEPHRKRFGPTGDGEFDERDTHYDPL